MMGQETNIRVVSVAAELFLCLPGSATSPKGRRECLPHHVKAALASAVVCLLLLAGCSRDDRPPLGMVSGTVTLDGKPLADARLIFEPIEGGRASTGSTDSEGKYELIYIRKDKGAKLGPHLVRISAATPDAAHAELLPACYNAQTTLRADVKPGPNQIDFTLTSSNRSRP